MGADARGGLGRGGSSPPRLRRPAPGAPLRSAPLASRRVRAREAICQAFHAAAGSRPAPGRAAASVTVRPAKPLTKRRLTTAHLADLAPRPTHHLRVWRHCEFALDLGRLQ